MTRGLPYYAEPAYAPSRLEMSVLLRVERGLPAFRDPITAARLGRKNFAYLMSQRSDALKTLYAKRLIRRGRKGPELTARGSALLDLLRRRRREIGCATEYRRGKKACIDRALSQEAQGLSEVQIRHRLRVATELLGDAEYV